MAEANDNIFISPFAFQHYSSLNSVSTSTSLVAPKTGNVTIYYYTLAQYGDEQKKATVDGFNGLVSSLTEKNTFSSIKMYVIEGQTYTLTLSASTYVNLGAVFVMVYH